MSSILVILSYASQQSVEHSLYKEIQWLCHTSKISIQTIDLYREDFDPIQREKESEINKRMVRMYQEMILSSDSIIFISPVSFNRCNAMLEGFIEKIFTQGFAYQIEPSRNKPLLNNKTLFILFNNGVTFLDKISTTTHLIRGFISKCFKKKGSVHNILVSNEEHDNIINSAKVIERIRKMI
jgi:NAD(P)H dehydrogenase (quinone)